MVLSHSTKRTYNNFGGRPSTATQISDVNGLTKVLVEIDQSGVKNPMEADLDCADYELQNAKRIKLKDQIGSQPDIVLENKDGVLDVAPSQGIATGPSLRLNPGTKYNAARAGIRIGLEATPYPSYQSYSFNGSFAAPSNITSSSTIEFRTHEARIGDTDRAVANTGVTAGIDFNSTGELKYNVGLPGFHTPSQPFLDNLQAGLIGSNLKGWRYGLYDLTSFSAQYDEKAHRMLPLMNTQGTGTVSITALSTTVNGAGTAFQSDFASGDIIWVLDLPNNTRYPRRVATVTSDIVLDVDASFPQTVTTTPYFKDSLLNQTWENGEEDIVAAIDHRGGLHQKQITESDAKLQLPAANYTKIFTDDTGLVKAVDSAGTVSTLTNSTQTTRKEWAQLINNNGGATGFETITPTNNAWNILPFESASESNSSVADAVSLGDYIEFYETKNWRVTMCLSGGFADGIDNFSFDCAVQPSAGGAYVHLPGSYVKQTSRHGVEDDPDNRSLSHTFGTQISANHKLFMRIYPVNASGTPFEYYIASASLFVEEIESFAI